jgi:hypothetical protein
MKKKARISYQKMAFFVSGIGSLLWFLIRVIPKPSRSAYPCMRTAAPIASSFVLYLLGLVSTAALFKKSKQHYLQSRYLPSSLFLFAAMFAGLLTTITADKPAYANNQAFSQQANAPMGTAKGINPGRVVWIYDPDATNADCTNAYGDGWFLTKNNNQDVINQMVSSAVQILTGATTDLSAWNAIFRYYNQNHGKGSVSYSTGEKILIKVNATSAWSGNYSTSDLSKVNNGYYGIAETSPQVVLAVLRQLVNVVGVAQSNIYVGDPMKHIYIHCYELWHSEFPNVKYLDHDNYSNLGRVQVVQSSNPLIFYSDRGAVLRTGSFSDASSGSPILSDYLYTVFQDVEYMINIPALKAHARAGITLFAKNHLGSQSRDDAKHLHMGLVNPDEDYGKNYRTGTKLYRVQVDLMGHKLLGGKELFYLLDGLWAGPEAVDSPNKWTSTPFNNDWTSSIFASQDPVAIESVAFDFLRTEYTASNSYGTYPQMKGVDEYLHQAADVANWPTGITYDPENDGTPLASLGVHEHWNNETNKQYSRNLGTGDGIELYASVNLPTGIKPLPDNNNMPDLRVWTSGHQVNIEGAVSSNAFGEVYNLLGLKVFKAHLGEGNFKTFTVSSALKGVYIIKISDGDKVATQKVLF